MEHLDDLEKLKTHSKTPDLIDELNASSPDKVFDLLHKTKTELQVHQCELELQNQELAKARDKAEMNAQYFEDVFEYSPIGMMLLNETSFIKKINKTLEGILNCSKPFLIDKSFSRFTYDLNQNCFLKHLKETLASDNQKTDFIRVKIAEQNEKILRIISRPFRHENETLVLSNVEDVTQKLKDDESLGLAASVFENASEGILICDDKLIIAECNEATSKIVGVSRNKFLGLHIQSLFKLMMIDLEIEQLYELESPHTLIKEFCGRYVKNIEQTIYLKCSFVKFENHEKSYYLVFINEITEQKNSQRRLEHSAFYDELTDLPNRVKLRYEINELIKENNFSPSIFAIAFMDLDGFKSINDNHGHDVGDKVLKSLARRIHNVLREEDTVGRIGGDEFVIIFKSLNKRKDCEKLISRIMDRVNEPIKAGSETFDLSFSVGLTFFPQAKYVSADQLLRQANHATYEAKMNGKSRYEFYKESTEEFWHIRTNHARTLKNAISKDEFTFFLQPIVDKGGQIRSYEVLLRWLHPRLGTVLPNEILTSYNTEQLDIEIDRWVIQRAYKLLSKWRYAGKRRVLCINICEDFINDSKSLDFIKEMELMYPNVMPEDIEFELVESAIIDVSKKSHPLINELIRTGYCISLDDFGTGYSSLSYFRLLPADIIKIDKSFVDDIWHDKEREIVCKCIIDLSHAFNKKVIAEGIENYKQYSILKELGCDFFQGYMISEPIPASDIDV